MILKIQIIITAADTFYCCDRFASRGFGFIDMKNALCFTAIGAFEVGKFITERFECHPAVRVANNNIPDEKHNVTRSQDIGGILGRGGGRRKCGEVSFGGLPFIGKVDSIYL